MRPSLLSLLVAEGVAPEDQLRLALTEGMATGERLGEVVLRRGWLDEPGLAQVLARQWNLPFLADESLRSVVVEREALSQDEARRLGGCVVTRADGRSTVVVAEPTAERLNALAEVLGERAAFSVVTPSGLRWLIEDAWATPEQPSGSSHPSAADAAARESYGEAAAEDEQAELLMSEIEAASLALAALRGRVEHLTEHRSAAEREATELRAEIDRLHGQLDVERRRAAESAQELERERSRHDRIATTLTQLLGDLGRHTVD